VTANPDVQAGLSRAGARWALTAMRDGNWFPLTWLSHMAVVQAAGLDPRAHHLVNLALHALGAVLLFVALRRMTGARWPSALAAALFGVHPLHVESVAWVAERKDVLSGVFWMLALVGYAEYAKRPGWRRYLLVAVPFALGLLSKPMVVTLQFVLLLLDLWPLGRLGPAAGGWGGAGRLVREKAPLLAMSAASAVVTFIAQRSTGSVAALGQVPLGLRAANALDAWVAYAAAFFRPAGLAVFYPYPAAIPWWHTLAAALALLAVTALAARRLSSSPYLAVGWSWYLGTLVPVIGLVQVGSQARADRYTYIPSVGLSIVVAWGLAEVWSRHRQAGRLLAGAAAVGAGACVLLTWQQVQVWRTSATLFGHALAVTRDNFVALDGVGLQLRLEGRLDEAIEKFGEAVRIAPAFAVARNNLGEALLARGRAEAALPHLLEAVRLGPDLREARVSLGTALASLGRLDEAIATLEEAVRRWPDYAVARSKLALALAGRGRAAEGLPHARTAAALAPDSPDAHYALARVLLEAGRPDEAADEFARTLRLRPDFAECRFNLGNLLAARGDLEGAIREYRAALIAKPDDARTHANLGAALATLGRVDEAIAEFTEALRLDPGLPGVRANLEHARAAKR
jgi:tetratricopeptide (TPR) repeat protein